MNDISKVSPYRIDGYFETKTNCITKIPQNIKLELIEGTLIIKAGSKVYIPNGINVFKEYITKTDISVTDVSPRSVMIVINESDEYDFYDLNDTYSGDVSPSVNPFGLWYDTLNNLIKVTKTSGTSWTDGWSLPICIMTSISTTGFTSIDQIFNGIGYIGNTIYTLPNIEGLIPNGRNEDGSLNNISLVSNKVLTLNHTTGETLTYLGINKNSLSAIGTSLYNYNEQLNFNTFNGENDFRVIGASYYVDSTGHITSFNPKNVFQAVDRNEADYVIESKINSDGSWYRKYKSGWLEQGGISQPSSNNAIDCLVTFPKPYANTNYTFVHMPEFKSEAAIDNRVVQFKNATTTSILIYNWSARNVLSKWFVTGQGA